PRLTSPPPCRIRRKKSRKAGSSSNASSNKAMGKPLDIKCFVLKNTNRQTVIYRTSDPSLNLLTFTIINATEADLPLKGGAPGVGSTFTIDFSSILPDPIVEGLAIALPAGWDK